MKTDLISNISKIPKGSESPNFFLDQKSRKRSSDTEYDKFSSGCPVEATVMQPRMREHRPSRGQYLLVIEVFHYSSYKYRVRCFLKGTPTICNIRYLINIYFHCQTKTVKMVYVCCCLMDGAILFTLRSILGDCPSDNQSFK